MVRFGIVCTVIALSASCAIAQESDGARGEMAAGKASLQLDGQESKHFCLYEGKRYSEGAVKAVDGVTLICMRQQSFVTSSQDEPAVLTWENTGGSARAKLAFGRVTATKK